MVLHLIDDDKALCPEPIIPIIYILHLCCFDSLQWEAQEASPGRDVCVRGQMDALVLRPSALHRSC